MRGVLIAVLVLIVSGVHTAAALNAGQPPLERIEHSMTSAQEIVETDAAGLSHHSQCCEKGGNSDSSAAGTSCSVDCASFLVVAFDFRHSSERVIERTPHPKFSTRVPYPEGHPPKHG